MIDIGVDLRKQTGIRIGFFSTDNDGYIFSPTPLCIEEEKSDNIFPNAIELSENELNKIIKSLVPDYEKEKAEVGKDKLTLEDVKQIKSEVDSKPFVKPDLQRQIRVITSIFQIVEIDFQGGKLQNHKFSISAESLGIKNKEIEKRITASYKIFDSVPLYKIEDLYSEFDQIKKEFLTQVDKVGNLLLYSKYNLFLEKIKSFKEKIKKTKSDCEEDLDKLLEKRNKELSEFITSNLNKLSTKEKEKLIPIDKPTKDKLHEYTNRLLDKNFPNGKDLLSKIELKLKVYNVSEHLINDADFISRIEKVFDKSIKEIINQGTAVRTKESDVSFFDT